MNQASACKTNLLILTWMSLTASPGHQPTRDEVDSCAFLVFTLNNFFHPACTQDDAPTFIPFVDFSQYFGGNFFIVLRGISFFDYSGQIQINLHTSVLQQYLHLSGVS